jgi:CheY-like chemotaxis protein
MHFDRITFSPKTIPAMQKKNILLIDDDFTFNYIARVMLERNQNVEAVSTALNGREAIRELSNAVNAGAPLPDLIFVDINMPVMNGFQFIKAFREMDLPGKDKVSLIMVTSSMDPRDVEEARSLGVDQYYSKPLSENDIKSALAR